MSKVYTLLFAAIFMLCITGNAQVSVTATAGTTGPTSYTTLKAAFDAINAGTHKGAITVAISGNTTEAATVAVNANAAPASYTAITVTSSGAFVITSNIATPLINLNGATNVTIDGTNGLQLVNTNTTGNVISFNNDATTNTIKNTIIKGATNLITSGLPTSGVVAFGSGTTNGNDNNTIDNCDIDGIGAAACCLYSTSAATTTGGLNSGNIVKNSKLHDNINANLTSSITLFLDGGSTGWTIQDNSFYHTASLATPQQYPVRSILIIPDFTTDAHTVTGNFIGGNSPNANGTMTLSATGTNAIGYIGLDVETAGPGNLIQNNTVKNVSVTYGASAGSFGNAAIFAFIGGFNGTTTINNNKVLNLTYNNTDGFISFQGIHVNARVTATGTVTPTFTVTNNTVSNITGGSGGTGGDIQFTGIRLETSSSASLANTSTSNPKFTVSGNTVSNISAPFAGAATLIRGIGTVVTQGGSGATLSTALLFPVVDINNNTIHSFTTTSLLANYGAGVCAGIHFGGTAGGNNTTDVQKITQNTIFNLSATTTTDAGTVVVGISSTLGVFDISRNRVYDLKNSSTGATANAGIVGITLRNALASSTITNNFISLGNGQATNLQIFGILQNLIAAGPVNVYYNTVVISGAGAAGNNKTTAGFLRGTETLSNTITTPVVIKNNILQNTRTGGGSHFAIGNTYTTAPIGWTSDYNDLYSSTASTIALWGAASNDLATYKTNSGDVNSKSVLVNFVNAPIGDLHLTGTSLTDANLQGTPIAGITTDYDAEARNATTPIEGADEPSATCTAPAITTQPVAQSGCVGSSTTFTVVASGNSPSYQWRKGGTNISNANAAGYTIPSVVAGDAGNYDVVITNSCGTVTSASVALTVNANAAITTQPTNQTVCVNNPATFTVVASGPGLTYQWKKGTANIAGATSATYTIANAVAGDAGTYSVVVTGTCGQVTSSAVTLTVNTCTAVPTVDENITSTVLMPNVVRNNTMLRVNVRKAMKVEWFITDAEGRVVMKFSQQLVAGQNDLNIKMDQLAAGTYFLGGTTSKGRTGILPFFRK